MTVQGTGHDISVIPSPVTRSSDLEQRMGQHNGVDLDATSKAACGGRVVGRRADAVFHPDFGCAIGGQGGFCRVGVVNVQDEKSEMGCRDATPARFVGGYSAPRLSLRGTMTKMLANYHQASSWKKLVLEQ
ncbi:hypothetical protein GLAREA_00052 [Glarea lozoyensis ATCC 20868]|uniref:Uncharacterized protein n=1 Tax=Glarea lozoyensis (strain ATCC 20868 / MF5171) TaxID=1116229 RepID=S3CVB0_GLAL2|nr:uncharacterized protein GLAREA_00052 [Glarea lozoyensis ATCC 20868]EPE28894.1 hypothetical protein GLAREA_00052 [Glarea lozoyensis ATCC 20868]